MTATLIPQPTTSNGALRVLELRSADGAGGGPEKTILLGASLSCPEEFDIHIAYLRGGADQDDSIRRWASDLEVQYMEFHAQGKFDFGLFRRLCDYVQEHRIQIVHSHEYKSNLLAIMLRRKFPQLQILSTAHGWTGHSFREQWLYYPLDKRLLRQFPTVISVSSEISKELVRSGVQPATIHTINNAIDPHLYYRDECLRDTYRANQGLTPDLTVFGTAGRLEPQKRFDLLLRGFREVLNRPDQPAVLLIAGEGSQRQKLESLIQELDLTGHAVLLGHQSDMRSFFSGIDVFVQSSDYEGTSNAVLEAMATEVPIVATRAGGTADILDHDRDALLLDVGDTQGLANAMSQILDSPAAAAERARQARSKVEGPLSFQNRNRGLEQIYTSMVDSIAAPNLEQPKDQISRVGNLKTFSAEPVRVCIVIDALRKAGTELRLRRLINSYDRRRVVPYLVLLDGDNAESRDLEPECEILRLKGCSLRRPTSLKTLWSMRQFFRRHQIDVVEVYYRDGVALGVLAARLAGAKCVTTSFNLGYWIRWYDRLMFLLYRPMVNHMLANCYAAADAGRRKAFMQREKTSVLENGIDLADFLRIPLLGEQSQQPVRVGMVANLRPIKNPGMLVSAARQLAAQGYDLRFSIAGAGELESQLRAQIDAAGLSERFSLLQAVEDIPEYLSDIDIAVLCSHSEGMSNAILEYMAAGRAIVATKVGGNSELIRDEVSGLLVARNDSDGLVMAIKRYMQDRDLMLTCGQNARETAQEKYNCDAMVERYQSFYLNLKYGKLGLSNSGTPLSTPANNEPQGVPR